MLEYIGLITCVIIGLLVIFWITFWACVKQDCSPNVVTVVFALIIIALSCTCYNQTQQIDMLKQQVPPEMEMIHDVDYTFMHTSEINDSLLYLVFDYYGVSDAKYVLAQAKIESGNYTSDVFKRTNNFLGLYDSKHSCYFSFDSWQDCVKGYVNSVQYRKKPNEPHTDFLKRIGYAEDPAYIAKVKQIYNTL